MSCLAPSCSCSRLFFLCLPRKYRTTGSLMTYQRSFHIRVMAREGSRGYGYPLGHMWTQFCRTFCGLTFRLFGEYTYGDYGEMC